MSTDSEYPMSRMRRGPALIFHDLAHQGQAETLRKVLVDLRFNPATCRLVTAALPEQVVEVSQSAGLREDWCVLVAVLSSVVEDKVVTGDVSVSLSDLCRPFAEDRCPLLKDKPKIFFMLDARNNNGNVGLGDDNYILDILPEEKDFLIVRGIGDSFISSLSGELSKCMDGETGLVEVIRRAVDEAEPSSGSTVNLHSTLRCNLMLRSKSRAVMYETDEEAISQDRITLSVPEAASLTQKSLSLYKNRKYSGAIALMDEVVEITSTKLGPEHHETLNVMSWRSELLLGTGHHNEEALELLDSLIEKRLRISGEQHFSTLIALSNKAFCIHNLGQYHEALQLHDEVIEKKYLAIGKEHPFTLTSLHHKAMTLNKLEKHEEALELKNKVLENMYKILGPVHKEILTVLHNKAFTLKSMGRYDEALELYSEVIDKRSRMIGEEHPRTLMSMANMAGCLEAAGRSEEAMSLLEEVLEKRIRVLGEEHEYTKNTADRLVNLIRIMDNMASFC